ncbi:MAG: carbohydrate kinase [Bilifractor sp.]
MDFIAVGEMVIDFLPGSEKGSYIRNAGGAPANVAISIARNGLSSGIYCKVGDDDFGRFLIKTLQENHVTPLSPALCGTATTTMAFVSLNENNERSFTFARKPGADMMLSPEEIKDADIAGCKILEAGSCSLSAGTSADATMLALKKAHANNKTVAFDINYRNLMWNNDKKACTKKVQEILPFVDLLKISEEEVDMVGGHENIPSFMEHFGITCTVLTLGGNGAEFFYKGTHTLVPGWHLGPVKDTTGAGDAFWGGFLSRLIINKCDQTKKLSEPVLSDAVKYGNVSGGLSVLSKGAISSLPSRTEIENIIKGGNMHE